MGYYSNMESVPSFRLKKGWTVDRLNRFLKRIPGVNKKSYLEPDFYHFIEEHGMVVFEKKDDDYYCKWYADEEIARVIRHVIADDSVTEMEFGGEDGLTWGYRISSKGIQYGEAVMVYSDNFVWAKKKSA